MKDAKKREIKAGDLLKSYHFYDRRLRKKQYLYHVATTIDGTLMAVPYAAACGLHKNSDGGACRVDAMAEGTFEIVASSEDYFPERSIEGAK